MRRRGLLAGAVALVAAAAAGVWRFTDLVVKHYAPSPYDDLLSQVVDREAAAKLGRAATHGTPDISAIVPKLRGESKLAVRASTDAEWGRIALVDGWVVPQSVADYALVAYQAALFDKF